MHAILAALIASALAFSVGQRVSLSAPELDQRVFVFTDRGVLDAYRVNVWSADDVASNSFLVGADTRAIVVEIAGADVGVKITAGPFRGRYGWVRDVDTQP